MTLITSKDKALTRQLPQCEFVMTHGEGEHTSQTDGVLKDRKYKISYDLMMCKFCGNLQGAENNRNFCPALMKTLNE